jgi:very-short-patch-repair endonuclease
MHYDTTLHRLALHQHGLIAKTQAHDAGMSTAGWYRRIEIGSLIQVHPGVARVPSAPVTFRQRATAAALAIGRDARASHVTAARLWCDGDAPAGLLEDDDIHVIARRAQRLRSLDRVVVHRPTDRGDLRRPTELDVPATGPLRTALDLGAVVGPELLRETVETLLVRGLVSIPALDRALRRHARPGRTGCGPLRAFLDERALGDKPADSVVEARLSDVLQRHALPVPTLHHVVRHGRFTAELDHAYLDLRIDIEVDGFRWHGDRLAFERDRARDAQLAALGWVVLRFTWLQIVRRPDLVARRVAEVRALREAA